MFNISISTFDHPLSPPPSCTHVFSANSLTSETTETVARPITPLSEGAIAALQYVWVRGKNCNCLAMIDSGSQLNLIGSNLLPHFNYENTPNPTNQLRSADGRDFPTAGYVQLQLTLTGLHQPLQTNCAVISLPHLQDGMLFGMPFLQQIRACHDVYHRILYAFGTPILLYDSSTPTPWTVVPTTMVIFTMTPPIDLTASILTPEQVESLYCLLWEFRDLWESGKRGSTHVIQHVIRLTTSRPVVLRPRVFGEAQTKVIAREVQQMLDDGVIERSDSPYAAEIVLVLKKTNDWRICIDFRALNDITIPDRYPLPRISDLLYALRYSRYFVALDLKGAYWQIPLEKKAQKYTAFRCSLGLFEHKVMPFGLRNAPATFQRLMDILFSDLRFSGVLAYLDDILIHAPTFEGAQEKLLEAFKRLRMANLTLNLPKSVFYPRELRYLGQIFTDGTLIPDPTKVAALHKIPPPQNISQVRRVLGLLGYYQNFIPGYMELIGPLFDLLKGTTNKTAINKRTPVIWTPQHQEALETAIARLSATTLTVPPDDADFVLTTDASDTTITAILHVKTPDGLRPVEYYMKRFGGPQLNWPIREKEAFAIYAGVLKFDSYLRGRHFDVYTDHQSLQWMKNTTKGKIARWMCFLSEFDMTVHHKPGTQMEHVDYFTREIPEEPELLIHDRMIYFIAHQPIPQLNEVLQAQQEETWPMGRGYATLDGVLHYHARIWAPPHLRNSIIAACHSTAPFNHPGIKRTLNHITRIFNWPNINQDVRDYIDSCLLCKQARAGPTRRPGLLQTHPVPALLHTVYMDFWQCRYGGKAYLTLTLVDQLSKWGECIIIPNKKGEIVASAFLQHWVARFGVPAVLISDNDKSFLSTFFKTMTATLGITRITSSPYHPEGNAVVEAFHKSLARSLRLLLPAEVSFEDAIALSLLAYRSVLHTTTHESPAYLLYGHDLRLAPDHDWRFTRGFATAGRAQLLSSLRLDVQWQAYQRRLTQNQKRQKDFRPATFELGQLILRPLDPSARLNYTAAFYKAAPRWSVPARVVRVLGQGQRAMVECLLTQRVHQVHIHDIDFIRPPVHPVQEEEWKAAARMEVKSMMDLDERDDLVKAFFTRVTMPQATSSSRTKRPRLVP